MYFSRKMRSSPKAAAASRFADAVMDLVRSEASAPAPIPFPWVRALPGLAALVLAVTLASWTGLGELARAPSLSSPQDAWRLAVAPVLEAASRAGTLWVAAALLLALATSVISMHLVSPRT